jgi:hypothetical protein
MKLFKTLLIYKLSFLLVFSLLAPNAAFAQRRKAAQTKSKSTVAKNETQTEKPAQACDGWRGTITYLEKEQDETFQPKGKNGFFKMKVNRVKEGSVVLSGTRMGKAKISLESIKSTEEESKSTGCCYQTFAGCSREYTLTRRHKIIWEDAARAEDTAGVNVIFNGGRYAIDFDLPAMKGKSTYKLSGGTTGYCDPKLDEEGSQENTKPDELYARTPVKAEGTVDPKNPDVLKGSMQPDKNTMIVWELTKAKGDCDDGDLNVAGLKLEQHVFPNPTVWKEIGENTVDGNQVKITATVSNSSKKSKSGTVTIKETTSGEVLGTKSVSVAGGGRADVEIEWDTNGFGWTDNRKNAPNRRIEASLSNGSNAEAEVKVYPKPIILVHGLWSNGAAWKDYHNYLEEAHSYAWKSFAVGADPAHGKMNTGDSAGNTDPTNSIFQNAQELGKQIKFAQESENAWRVDVVAHSMGGLISRFYIHHFMKMTPDGKPTITHLAMLGTPNQGSPWADIMFEEFKKNGHHVEALRELRTGECRTFNSQITNRKGVKFSIVYTDSIPFTGNTTESGDGVVSKSSAIWQITDISHSDSLEHTALTGKEDFMRFVYPRLAVGPRKAKQTASLNENFQTTPTYALNLINKNWIASADPRALAFIFQTETANRVRLKPKQTLEMEIPTSKSKRGAIGFFAPSKISATLTDAGGELLGENTAQTAEAKAMFRYIVVDKPIAAGTWKLKLENTDEAESLAFIVPVFDTNPLALEFVEIQKQTDGSVKMQAMLTNNGIAVKGAIISVKINNQAPEIALADDGKHGDGQANDGVYGATTGKLAAGEHFIEARATANGLNATATTVLTTGETN